MDMPSPSPETAPKNHGLSDTLAILGLVVCLLAWVFIPGIWEKAVAIVVSAILLAYLSYRSHFTRDFSPKKQHVVAVVLVVVVLGAGVIQLHGDWKAEHPETSKSEKPSGTNPASPAPQPQPPTAAAPPIATASAKKPDSPAAAPPCVPGTGMSVNGVHMNIGPGVPVGVKTTAVHIKGEHPCLHVSDVHANRGTGVDIEPAATAPTTVNIAPGGFAVSGGTLVNPQVTNNLGPAPINVHWEFDPNHQPSPSPSGHPRSTVTFYTDRDDEMGQFAVTCDRACLADEMCVLLGRGPGLTPHIVSSDADSRNIATFLFLSPFPGNLRCNLTVVSLDDKPVKILKVARLEIVDSSIKPQ